MANIQSPCEDISKFRKVFEKSKFIVCITGAGISAESGILTFQETEHLWRGKSVEDLLSVSVFQENPSSVWEWHHFLRELIFTKKPNPAHKCLAEVEKRFEENSKKFVIITQNIDELTQAGSKNVVELHGSVFRTQCIKCGNITDNYDSQICPGLQGKGAPEKDTKEACIPQELLPRCNRNGCNGLLRPDVIWYDEEPTEKIINQCSSTVDPANEFGPVLAAKGIPVAEFNIEKTIATKDFQFHINGPCGTTLPAALL